MNSVEQPDRHEKWKKLVDEQEKSGLSQSAFCKQHNLVLSKFGYHRGLIKSKNKVPTQNKNLFSTVQIKKNENIQTEEVKIVLPNGFQCFIPSQMDASHIKRLVEALLSC